MEHSQEPRRQRRRRRGLFALLMAGAALVSATGATMSLAMFTSTAASGNSVFTTGSITIGVNPASDIFTATGMMPGGSVPADIAGAPTGQAVTVTNSGTSQLRYAITGVATNAPLASALVITIKQPDGDAGSSCAAFSGTTVNVEGGLPATTVGTSATKLVGDPAQGSQTGDRVLAGGSSETLCFRATLPGSVSDPALEGATTTMTFTFSAEQTANNP